MVLTPRSTVRVAGSRPGMVRATEAFDQFLAEHQIQPRAVWQLKVVLDEVLSNVVNHAYAGRPGSFIDISFVLVDDEVEVTVVDDGDEVNPLRQNPPDTTTPLDERQAGGLGVHLVKQLTDRLEYRRRDGRNWLVFGRRVR